MDKTLIWSDSAKEDLRDVVFYLMRDSDVLAEIWIGELDNALRLLSQFPEMGKMNPEKRNTIHQRNICRKI
jgi:toxin ParE1/3/4